ASAAAQAASRRMCIGVVPAWSPRPLKTAVMRWMPAMPVTTPIAVPLASSTGPCSMWSSTKRATSSGFQASWMAVAGSPPASRSASASVRPVGSFSSRCSADRLPLSARLPTQLMPKSLASSPAKSTTRREWRSRMPASWSSRTASMAPSTPMIPSKRPPPRTVSVCEPVTRAGSDGSVPGSTPTTLHAASTSASSPAALIVAASHWRERRNGSVNTCRVQPGASLSRNSDRSLMSCQSRSWLGLNPVSGLFSAMEEPLHHSVELVPVLDLRPVTAAAEDVHAGVGDAAQHHEPHVERPGPVVLAPDDQRRAGDLVQAAFRVLRRGQPAAPRDPLGVEAGLVAGLHQLVGDEVLVVHHGPHQRAHLLLRRPVTAVVVADHGDRLRRHRRHRALHPGHAADQGQPADQGRVVDGHLEPDLPAPGVAEDVDRLDAELRHQAAEQLADVG